MSCDLRKLNFVKVDMSHIVSNAPVICNYDFRREGGRGTKPSFDICTAPSVQGKYTGRVLKAKIEQYNVNCVWLQRNIAMFSTTDCPSSMGVLA